MGYFWADMVKKASEMLAAGEGHDAFLKDKITTAEFFFAHILPETAALKAKVEAGAETLMALDAASF